METSQSPQKEWPAALRALRHRNFRLFFFGQLISMIGVWMEPVAASWLVYRLTGSALLLGTVAFAAQIPTFLLAPVGGIVADRYDRRSILIVTQSLTMLFTFVLAALTLTHVVRVWHVILLAALIGIIDAVDIPTHGAFTLDMVSREDLVNAIALNSSIFNGARVIGPALAGIVVTKIGEGWCFFANGVSFLAVIAGLLMMTPLQERPAPEGPQKIIEGFRFVTHTAPIRTLMLLLGLISFTGTPCVVLMPVFADQVLHSGARGLGLLVGAPGVGALCAAIILATRKGLNGLAGWIAVACNVFGVALVLFSLSRTFWLSVALLISAGFSVTLELASSNALIQSMVPDHMRGRVMSLYSLVFMGMVPLGALLAGGAAHAIGAPATVTLAGVISIIGGIVFAARLPALRSGVRELLAVRQAADAPLQELPPG